MDNNTNKTSLSNTSKPVIVNNLSKKNDGMSITALVLGIMSCVLLFSPIYSIIIGLIGLILGIISIVQKRDGFKFAISGIICSAIGLILGIIFLTIYILFII